MLLTIQAGLNILRRFVPIFICEGSWLAIFMNPPSWLILSLVLYYWPINLRNRQLEVEDTGNNSNNKPKQYSTWRNLESIILACFVLLFLGFMAALSPARGDSYRILLSSIFLVIFPAYVYNKLTTRSTNNSLSFITLLGLLIPVFFIIPLQIHIQFIIIILILALSIWSIYGLAFLPINHQKWQFIFNRYNPFTPQPIPTEYRQISLVIMGLSGLATLMFIVYAYLAIPRIETFGIYRASFNQVVEMAKANQLQHYGNESPKLPCIYNYLSRNGNVKVIQEKNELIVEFQIFTIGFGDGYTAFVYRSQPLDYKKPPHTHEYFSQYQLGDSWYWEKWVW